MIIHCHRFSKNPSLPLKQTQDCITCYKASVLKIQPTTVLKKRKTVTHSHIMIYLPLTLNQIITFPKQCDRCHPKTVSIMTPWTKMQILMTSETNIHLSSPFSLQSIFSFLLFFFHVLPAVVDAPSSALTPLTLG